jgi:Second Messenger Oligonucleotide or Dinucleotide Synthetase domain
MSDINKVFEDFLENTVNLNASRFDKIEKAREVLGTFIEASEMFKDLYVETTLQGSARQKTIIKPVGEDDEFDADLLVTLKENTEWSPADYHANLASLFKDSDRYKDITDTRGKTRCVTIDYNSDFHVDLVPAIERDGQMYIFNKSTDEEECTDGDGYSQWFEQQDSYAGGYLVPVVRLIKYLRDSRNDFDTRSVILTTIIGMQVQSDDQFGSLREAFVTIMDRLDTFLSIHDDAPTIENPAMPEETFDRNWKDDDNKSFKALKKAVETYTESASGAESLEDWQELFGDKFKEAEEDKGNKTGGVSAATAASGFVVGGSHAPTGQWSSDNDY